jgi:glycosyltransferase involved in cell wall biosynthesis
MMMISFVIPFFNRYDFVKEAVNSILSSAFKDIEIVLVDDASDADGLNELLEYIGHFKNIIYIKSEKNRGPGAARNTGLRAAKGGWIFFMDSDDLIYGDILPELARFLVKEYEADIAVMGQTAFIRTDGRREIKQFGDGTVEGIDAVFGRQPAETASVWNFFYNRNFLIKNDIYFPDTYFNEDSCFTVSAYCHAKKISYFSQCFYEYHYFTPLSINSQIERFAYTSSKRRNGTIKFFDTLIELSKSGISAERKYIIECLIYMYILHSQWESERYKNNKMISQMLDKLWSTIADYSENFSRKIYIAPCFMGAVNAAALMSRWGCRIAGFIDNNPESPRAAACKKSSGLNIYKINEIVLGGGGVIIFGKHTDAIAEQFNAMSMVEGKDYIKTGLL